MPDEDGVSQVFENIREWQDWGRRLTEILKEVKEKTGEAPICVMEEGGVLVHPELASKLHEPDNAGPLEFFRYLQRNGMMTQE
jgi:hypothetical protein